jgi:aromatic ring-opening dioxygenase catalytic subunit (LigB family)
MNDASLIHDMYGFATELRQLAYTMPGGHEDPLVRLSERMVRYAQEEETEPQPRWSS